MKVFVHECGEERLDRMLFGRVSYLLRCRCSIRISFCNPYYFRSCYCCVSFRTVVSVVSAVAFVVFVPFIFPVVFMLSLFLLLLLLLSSSFSLFFLLFLSPSFLLLLFLLLFSLLLIFILILLILLITVQQQQQFFVASAFVFASMEFIAVVVVAILNFAVVSILSAVVVVIFRVVFVLFIDFLAAAVVSVNYLVVEGALLLSAVVSVVGPRHGADDDCIGDAFFKSMTGRI